MFRSFYSFIVAISLIMVGCDEGGHSGAMPPQSSEPSSCQEYVQGISATADTGRYVVAIQDANPAPPDKGLNTLSLRLTDAEGQPVDSGVTLVVEPWMPAHGHGSTNVTAQSRGADGLYDAPDVNLIMPGEWELRMLVTEQSDADTTHRAVFTFCAEG